MSQYYLDILKKHLSESKMTRETFEALVNDSRHFFEVLRVKWESGQSALRKEVVQEMAALKSWVQEHRNRQSAR